MEKIKPEVAGYRRVFNDGDLGDVIISKESLKWACDDCGFISIHPNGKPKFRPVYKTT